MVIGGQGIRMPKTTGRRFRHFHTMNKQSFILIILILALAIFVWQVFLPAYAEVSAVRQERNIWQEKLNDTSNLKQKLGELDKKYDALGEEAERMAAVVPQREDIPSLLVQLEALTSQNGLILNSIEFSTSAKKQDSAANSAVAGSVAPSGAKITAVNLNLSGTHSALRNFLKSVESNLRLMDVNFVSFEVSTVSDLTDFQVMINTYYRE